MQAPITEDTMYFRNFVAHEYGTDLNASSMRTSFHGTRRYANFQRRENQQSKLLVVMPLNPNCPCSTITLRVQ